MTPDVVPPGIDVGAYCRAVEAHLARVNDGHIIRLVGPAFELTRGWALAGVPLSIVFHGIELKAERHRAGRSRRPLRLEFCEHDVNAAFRAWRRAVGISGAVSAGTADVTDAPEASEDMPAARQPSLVKHLDRVLDRLGRVAGRLDLPPEFLEAIGGAMSALGALREAAQPVRGEARRALAAGLAPIDAAVIAAARRAAAPDVLARLGEEAAAELAAYRGRLPADAWKRSVELGVERLLRDHFHLPIMLLDS